MNISRLKYFKLSNVDASFFILAKQRAKNRNTFHNHILIQAEQKVNIYIEIFLIFLYIVGVMLQHIVFDLCLRGFDPPHRRLKTRLSHRIGPRIKTRQFYGNTGMHALKY